MMRASVGLALWLVACSQNSDAGSPGDGSSSPLPPDPSVYHLAARPADLSTGHDGASVSIALVAQDGLPPSFTMPDLGLQHHANGAKLPATVAFEPIAAGPPGVFKDAFVLHPGSPLDEGWYDFVIGMAAVGGTHVVVGASVSSFRVGSEPLLVGVGLCASDDLSLLPKVRLDFSEPVALPAGDPPIDVTVDGQPASCALYDPPSDVNPGLGLTCTPPIPAAASVSVRVRPGIVSLAASVALRTSAGPLPQTIDVPAEVEAACRYWHETSVPAD
jgi:hypothetical protein